MKRLRDRVAVVTGAASGIGRATAIALADRGAHLALVDVNERGLAEVRSEVEGRGRRASAHDCDVADRARCDEVAGNRASLNAARATRGLLAVAATLLAVARQAAPRAAE
ncbi:MAG: SDR family NAD(P)-dependent oxidoreductase, partial [Polyangiaceae bacterium]|nr:SDR family NAD(P)-dependent oxidoreductase [Polyangiaceae bacterium]